MCLKDNCKLLTNKCKKSGCSEAEEDDLGHLEMLEAAAAAPCEILLRSDFPSLFAGLIWGWTSVLKANYLIFLSFGKPSTETRKSLTKTFLKACSISLGFIRTKNIETEKHIFPDELLSLFTNQTISSILFLVDGFSQMKLLHCERPFRFVLQCM